MERALSLHRDSLAIRAKTEETRTKIFQVRKQQQMEASAQISKSSGKTLSAMQKFTALRNHEDKENRGTLMSRETFRRALAEYRLNQRKLEANRLQSETCKSCVTSQYHSSVTKKHLLEDCKPEDPPIKYRIQGCGREENRAAGGRPSKRKATDCNQNSFEVPDGEEEVSFSGYRSTDSATVTSHNWTLVTPMRRGSRRFFLSPELSEEIGDESSETSLWSKGSTGSTAVAAKIRTSKEEFKSISTTYNKNETLLVPIGKSHDLHGLISKSSEPTFEDDDSVRSTSGDGIVCKEGLVISGTGSLRLVDDLSNISRVSEVNIREEISTGNFNGAFHSTFNYPLHSTMNYQGTNHLDISPVPSSSVALPSRLPTCTRSKNTRAGQLLCIDGELKKFGSCCTYNHQTQDLERQPISLNKPENMFSPRHQYGMKNSPPFEIARSNNDIASRSRNPSLNENGALKPLHSKKCFNPKTMSLHQLSLRRQTGQVELTTSASISDSARCRQTGLLERCRFQKLKASARLKNAAATVTQAKLPTSSETVVESRISDACKSEDLKSTGDDEVAPLVHPLRSFRQEDIVMTTECPEVRKRTAKRRRTDNCLPSLLAFVPCKSVKRFVGGTVSTTVGDSIGPASTLDNVAAWLCAGINGTVINPTTSTSPGHKRPNFDSLQISEDDDEFLSSGNSNLRNSVGRFKAEDIARFSALGNGNNSCTIASGRRQHQSDIDWKNQHSEIRRRPRRGKPISRLHRRDLRISRGNVCRHEAQATQFDNDVAVCTRTLGSL